MLAKGRQPLLRECPKWTDKPTPFWVFYQLRSKEYHARICPQTLQRITRSSRAAKLAGMPEWMPTARKGHLIQTKE